MFIHQGKERTFLHNLQIGIVLSFVAGMVNVAGFFSVQRLTTNITGHFAYFMDAVFSLHWTQAVVFFAFILCFFMGSVISALLIELGTRPANPHLYIIPVLVEIFLLLVIGLGGAALSAVAPDIIAGVLLFAMGLQNALVTKVSRSMVRTTHLTGLFTDLGIEVVQLVFYKKQHQRKILCASIRLRLSIIVSFFSGGLLAAILYSWLQLQTLVFGAALLIAVLVINSRRVGIK